MNNQTIMVADDEEEVLDTVSTLLELFGYNVVQAKDGLDAIAKYKEHKPGLIFLDIKMPKLDGYETFFELEKKFSMSKVIFMTAHADYTKWKEVKARKALELVEKPFSAEKIRQLTKKFYPKKRS